MTLTEEQRGTAAFDLEKARAMICHYRIENPGDADTDCGLEDLIRQANLAEEALDEIERLNAHINSACIESLRIAEEQVAEIERLRAEISEQKRMIWKTQQVKKEQYAQIKELKADLEQSERVVEARLDVIDQQAARIKELEADNQNLVTLNKSLMNNDWILRDNNRKYRKRAQKAEFLNKELKSKIGPDADAKPHCWQITEERKAAIRRAMEFVIFADSDSEEQESEDVYAWRVLQAMLEEAQ